MLQNALKVEAALNKARTNHTLIFHEWVNADHTCGCTVGTAMLALGADIRIFLRGDHESEMEKFCYALRLKPSEAALEAVLEVSHLHESGKVDEAIDRMVGVMKDFGLTSD